MSFHSDVELLQRFHDRVEDEPPTLEDAHYAAAKAAWWRIAESDEAPGNLYVYALLVYTNKYLPPTP